ncbi:hypothetical protein AX16_005308 [Volvariella volvacea WC 439]|nr:hypothetical protein AX16_005308 [Volvariella volvacea WC 439]
MSTVPVKKIITGIFIDDCWEVRGKLNEQATIATAVGRLRGDVAAKVNRTLGLQTPLQAEEMSISYFPSGASEFASLSSLGNMQLIALYRPSGPQKDVIKNHLSSNPQTVVEAVAALKERMDEQAQIIKTLTEESKGLKTQVTTLTEETKGLKTQVTTLTEETKGLKTQVTTLTEENRKKTGDIERLQTQVTRLSMQNEAQAHDINRLETNNEKLEIEGDGLRENIKALNKALEKEKKERMNEIEELGKVRRIHCPSGFMLKGRLLFS